MEGAWYERGRQPFPIAEQAKDYSGRDLINLYLVDTNALTHAFLNGVSIEGCAFVRSRLDHCEMAESSISQTKFEAVELTASDLVRATIDDVEFVACDFSDGDWRQSQFRRVKFTDCVFSHTTINLCSFVECSFSGRSASLDHRSTNYNTFAQCVFEHQVSDHLVVSHNFGLPAVPGTQPPALAMGGVTLEQICVMSSTGSVTVANLSSAIRRECEEPNANQSPRSRRPDSWKRFRLGGDKPLVCGGRRMDGLNQPAERPAWPLKPP